LSNEAGCGTSPIAHASSDNSPHMQGCLGVYEVFFDTVVLCTLTALVILLYGKSALSPISLVLDAYGHYFGIFGKWFIKISCIIYAYSTVLSQFYYGDKSLSFISGNKTIHVAFAFLYALVSFISPLVPSDTMWLLSDINVSILIFFNVTVLNFIYRKNDA
jgi:AGCS family alanine or glycine:cation symporter